MVQKVVVGSKYQRKKVKVKFEAYLTSQQSQMDRIMIIDRDHAHIAAVKSLLPQYKGSSMPSLWLLIS